MAPKVLIVGGGIAGPSLAFWLAQLDFSVTILERHPNLRANGQQLDLRGQGLTAMRYMGLEPQVRAKVVDEEGLQFVNSAGVPQASLIANKTGKGQQSFTSEFEIMRGDLVRILYEATKEKTRYIFGTTVESMEEVDDGVKVVLKDGSEEVYDLVVVADGDRSKTRRMILGSEAPEPFRSMRHYIAYFTAPRVESDSKYATMYHEVGSRIVATRADNPRTIQVYMAVLTTGRGSEIIGAALRDRKAGMAAQKQAWAEAFKDAGWQTKRFLQAMEGPLASDFYSHEVGQVRMSHWSKGRVTLLGDAGYCPTTLTGFGTSLAMVGGYVLAGELSRHTAPDGKVDVLAALEGYEKTLRPLVDEVQAVPSWLPLVFLPRTWWQIKALQTFVWVFAILRINKLISMITLVCGPSSKGKCQHQQAQHGESW